MAAFVKALAARYVPDKRLVASGPACGAGSTSTGQPASSLPVMMDVINANNPRRPRRPLCQQLLEDLTAIEMLAAASYQDADDGEANY